MALPELLAHSPAAFIAVLGALGLLVGSFLNVVIHRLPVMMDREWRRDCTALLTPDRPLPDEARYNLAVPRSCCPRCGGAISEITANQRITSFCRTCQPEIPA